MFKSFSSFLFIFVIGFIITQTEFRLVIAEILEILFLDIFIGFFFFLINAVFLLAKYILLLIALVLVLFFLFKKRR